MDDVAHERKHGDTSVFDLRLSQKSNSFLRSGIPEALGCEAKGIEIPKNRVAFLRQNSQVVGSFHRHGRLGCRTLAHRSSIEAGRSECSGGAGQEGCKKELHCHTLLLRNVEVCLLQPGGGNSLVCKTGMSEDTLFANAKIGLQRSIHPTRITDSKKGLKEVFSYKHIQFCILFVLLPYTCRHREWMRDWDALRARLQVQ